MTFQLSKNELLNKVLWLIIFLVLTALVFFFVKKQEFKQAQTNGSAVVVVGEQKINEETPRYKIDITQPVVPNDDAIAAYIRSTVTSFKENASDEENFPEGSSCTQHELSGSYKKVVSKKMGTVSYVYSMYEFTCGAHGNTALTTFVFNNNIKNESWDISDILASDQDSRSPAPIEKALLEGKLKSLLGDYYDQEMVRSGLGMYEKGYAQEQKDLSKRYSLLQNFTVSDDGITFIFGQYQVAPYVAGMPEVFVSWNELAPYLNSSFELRLKAANISILK